MPSMAHVIFDLLVNINLQNNQNVIVRSQFAVQAQII